MVEPRLSVRSAKARDLAHRLARRENRSTWLSARWDPMVRQAGHEPASTFCSRIASAYGVEIDLEAAIRGAPGRLIRDLSFDLPACQGHFRDAEEVARAYRVAWLFAMRLDTLA